MNEVLAVAHRAETTSRPERETHVITAPLLSFDLSNELARLRRERPYAEGLDLADGGGGGLGREVDDADSGTLAS